MAEKRAARQRHHLHRAYKSPLVKADVDIVQQRIQEEWEKGCTWAAIAITLTITPMIALGCFWGWF